MSLADPCRPRPGGRVRDDALRTLAAVHDDLGQARSVARSNPNPEARHRSLDAAIELIQSTIRSFLVDAGVCEPDAN